MAVAAHKQCVAQAVTRGEDCMYSSGRALPRAGKRQPGRARFRMFFFRGADDAFGVNPRFFFRGVDVPVEGLARPLGNQVFNISRRYDNQMKAFALRVLVDVHIIVSCMR